MHMERVTSLVGSQPSPRGRPREFDIDQVLDKAISVFCERGFHGASLNDLAGGMQLTQGSIYKAFKDKQKLFCAALDRQETLYGTALRKAVDKANTGYEKVRAALYFYLEMSHGVQGMQGCLVVTTAVELASTDPEIARRVRNSFRYRQQFLKALILTGQEDGSIAKDVDREGTAWLMLFLFQGLRVVGKTGATRKELSAVATAAMRMLG
jgi:TetR/AcrR family transcriptional regulator, transcriptional repressor for nem operon